MEMWSGRWVAFLPIVSAVAVCFLVGLPAYIGWALAYNRKLLYSPRIMSTYGFLYSRFRLGSEWWEVHEIVRKMLLCGALVFLDELTQAVVTTLVSLCAMVSLIHYRPYRNSWVFVACKSAFFSTCTKYIMLLVLLGKEGARDYLSHNVIGWIMLSVDVFVFLTSLVALFAMFASLRAQIKKLEHGLEGTDAPSPTALQQRSRVKVINTPQKKPVRKLKITASMVKTAATHYKVEGFEKRSEDQRRKSIEGILSRQEISRRRLALKLKHRTQTKKDRT